MPGKHLHLSASFHLKGKADSVHIIVFKLLTAAILMWETLLPRAAGQCQQQEEHATNNEDGACTADT